MAFSSDFYLPDGLPLESASPEWLWEIFPFTKLDSSIGSLILVLALALGLAVVSLILAYVSKTFLPRALKFLGKASFFLIGIGLVIGAGLSVVSWNGENNISDHSMGVQVTRTTDWLKNQNVSADNRAVWDLVCFYYDNRNENCREGQHATVQYKGGQKKVRLESQPNGTIVLWDYENSRPLDVG